jgi:galactokinase
VTFEELFGSRPQVSTHAHGRVNLIGEHTDYNDGFVLPAALPLRTQVELAVRNGRDVRAWTTSFPDRPPLTFPLDVAVAEGDWADYVRGMVWALNGRQFDCGLDIRIESSVPLGSGLSSSAALLISVARAVREALTLGLDDVQLAVLARKAETDFVGAPVGIMDQMACSLADTSAALFIDTRTLAYAKVALPAGTELLVINSGVRHSHSAGDYRIRRDECHRAARMLKVAALRDVDVKDLRTVESLPDPLNRRARHVVTENARVLAAVEALKAGDVTEVGRLFRASHASMRDDFEVSVPAVDALVESTCGNEGVYGARLTGGGFGGAIVALTQSGTARAIGETVVAEHSRRFPHRATVVVPENEPTRTNPAEPRRTL